MIEQEQAVTYHTVTLGNLTREGDALVEITEQNEEGEQSTRTLHVPAGLPGERVIIAVEAAAQPRRGKRHRRWKPRPPRVWITDIIQPSPLRTPAPCPVFGACGGCQLQHMHYSAQLDWKRSVVHQLLHDIGGFEDPPLLETVPCDMPWHYRNHMRFSVNRSGQPGLTARGTHRVLPLASCPIAHEHINHALNVLSQVPNERPQVLLRCATGTAQMLIQPQPKPEVISQLAAAGFDIRADTMEEMLAGETFNIRPSSFFQTNTAQAEKMVQMVLNGLLNCSGDMVQDVAADLTHDVAADLARGLTADVAPARGATTFHGASMRAEEKATDLAHDVAADLARGLTADVAPARGAITFYGASVRADVAPTRGATTFHIPSMRADGHLLTIVDAYCGVGTFALLLARYVSKVIAIEESASAIRDAQWNLRGVSNVEVLKGKVEDVLPSLAYQVDGLVIDPPRAGCQQVVLDALVQHPVTRIVYVSCDPATLARDLNILCHTQRAYQLLAVQPLDMFPQTAHIECVAVLERI